EPAARVGDDRPPADTSSRCAERLGRVDGAVDEQPWGRAEHVREDTPPLELDDAAVAAPDQLVGAWIVTAQNQALRGVLEIGQDDRATVLADDLRQPLEQRRLGLVDPDVDLAAA